MFEKLKQIRIERKIDYVKMAEIIGLETGAAYWKKESGKTKFSLEQAKKVSDFLELPIETIFFEDEVSEMETEESEKEGE